jgi:flagellar hook-basal body complex protein FliE
VLDASYSPAHQLTLKTMNTITQQSLSLPPVPLAPSAVSGGAESSTSFKELLVDSIQQVNAMQVEADSAVEALFTGGDVNPAEVLTAVQKADLAFRLTMQMRNKLMDVYHEIQDIRI